METLLDHVILTVKDLDRSIAFYETALKPLGIEGAVHGYVRAEQQLTLHSLLWFSARVVLGSQMKTDPRLSLGPRT